MSIGFAATVIKPFMTPGNVDSLLGLLIDAVLKKEAAEGVKNTAQVEVRPGGEISVHIFKDGKHTSTYNRAQCVEEFIKFIK